MSIAYLQMDYKVLDFVVQCAMMQKEDCFIERRIVNRPLQR